MTCTASKSNKSVLWTRFNGRLELIFYIVHNTAWENSIKLRLYHHYPVRSITSKDRALHLTPFLSLSANITNVTLPSDWWMAPTFIQSCCSIMALWPGCDWLHMDSRYKWWMRVGVVSHIDVYVIIYLTSYISTLCVTEEIWYDIRPDIEEDCSVFKEDITSNWCRHPVCSGGLTLSFQSCLHIHWVTSVQCMWAPQFWTRCV